MLQNVIQQAAKNHQEYYQLLEEAFEANPQVFQAIIGFHKTAPYTLGNVYNIHVYWDNIFHPTKEGIEWLNDINNNNFQLIEAEDTLENKYFYFANPDKEFYQINHYFYEGYNSVLDEDEQFDIAEEAKKVKIKIHNNFDEFIDFINQYKYEKEMKQYHFFKELDEDLGKSESDDYEEPQSNILKLASIDEVKHIIHTLKNDFAPYFQQRIKGIVEHGCEPQYIESNNDYAQYLLNHGRLPLPNANFPDKVLNHNQNAQTAKQYIDLFIKNVQKAEFVDNGELNSLPALFGTIKNIVYTNFDDGDLCFEYHIKNNEIKSIELKPFDLCEWGNSEMIVLKCNNQNDLQKLLNHNKSKITP